MRSSVVSAEPAAVAEMFNKVVRDLVVTPKGEIRDATPPRPSNGPEPVVEAPPARRPRERWD